MVMAAKNQGMETGRQRVATGVGGGGWRIWCGWPALVGVLAGVMLLGGTASGQDETKDGKATKDAAATRKLRFLPVGDAPPFRQEVRDGVRYEIEPPAGSIPPREIVLECGGDATVRVRLLLGQTTAPLEVPKDLPQLAVRTAEGKPWLALDTKVSGDLLVVVWRDAGTSWSRPRYMLLPEAAYETGMVRLLNTTSAVINLTIGGHEQVLGGGKTVLYRAGVTEGLPMRMAWQAGDGGWRPFYSTSLTMNPGERGQIILYRAEPAPGRLPVKVVFLRELVPPPPETK